MRVWMAVAALGSLGGCLKPAEIEVSDAWVRLPAAAGRPGSGYFTLTGGAQGTTLISVRSDLAIRTEMHATMRMGGSGGMGAMTMRPLAVVPLAAEGEVRFAPGGRHLMLYGVSPSLKPGDTTILTFTFADGSRLERKAWAIGPGDPAPE
jgi:hypothetical protein